MSPAWQTSHWSRTLDDVRVGSVLSTVRHTCRPTASMQQLAILHKNHRCNILTVIVIDSQWTDYVWRVDALSPASSVSIRPTINRTVASSLTASIRRWIYTHGLCVNCEKRQLYWFVSIRRRCFNYCSHLTIRGLAQSLRLD